MPPDPKWGTASGWLRNPIAGIDLRTGQGVTLAESPAAVTALGDELSLGTLAVVSRSKYRCRRRDTRWQDCTRRCGLCIAVQLPNWRTYLIFWERHALKGCCRYCWTLSWLLCLATCLQEGKSCALRRLH